MTKIREFPTSYDGGNKLCMNALKTQQIIKSPTQITFQVTFDYDAYQEFSAKYDPPSHPIILNPPALAIGEIVGLVNFITNPPVNTTPASRNIHSQDFFTKFPLLAQKYRFFFLIKFMGHSFIQIVKLCIFFFREAEKKNTRVYFFFPRKSS